MLLATTTLDDAATAMQILHAVVKTAAMPETDRFVATLGVWWPAIEVLIMIDVVSARTESANTTIKNAKRTGRGFRNENNYCARVLLTSAANTAASTPLSRPFSPPTAKSRESEPPRPTDDRRRRISRLAPC